MKNRFERCGNEDGPKRCLSAKQSDGVQKCETLETDFAYICDIKQAPCIVANDYDTAAADDDDGDEEKKTR